MDNVQKMIPKVLLAFMLKFPKPNLTGQKCLSLRSIDLFIVLLIKHYQKVALKVELWYKGYGL